MKHRERIGLAAVFTVAMLAPTASPGQAVFGSIYGTVTDNTGAVVPNVDVVVTDVAKGTSQTIKANSSGDFTADHLIPDEYTVKIQSTGFKTFEQTGVRVFADTSVKIGASLQVGSTGETVSVSADALPLLKADRADVSTTLTSKEIIDLPIPDRNFTNLQLLLPGAQQLGWSHAASENPQGSKQIEVDGQAFAGVAFQLDGTDNQDPILGIIVINPNSDSLSETKITTQNFDAEFGKAVSSVVTAQTKSGTNAFHGSAFDYRESNANLARESFSQQTKNGFPPGLKNQFGGSIGGPILKDRVFFFGDYQGVRQRVGLSNNATVPTTHFIQSCLDPQSAGCDLSEYTAAAAAAYNSGISSAAAKLTPGQIVFDNRTGTTVPYANSIIPRAQLSAPALNILRLLQPYAPNTAGSSVGGVFGLFNNYSSSGNGVFNSDQWDVRGDWQATGRTHVFGRFSRFTDVLTGGTQFGAAGGKGFGIGGFAGTSQGANDSVAAGVDVALNDKLVTDVRLGYFRYNINTFKFDSGTNTATALGLPGLNQGDFFTSGSPEFAFADNYISGSYGAGLSTERCNCPLREHEDQFQLANNWTRTIGNHSVKFGADLRYARNLRVPSDQNRAGQLNFTQGPTSNNANTSTGLGLASFVLGDVATFNRYASTTTNAKEFQKRDFFYVQDTWRASNKLTVNYGLRYELYFPESVNGKGNGALLNLSTGYLQVAGYGNYQSNMNQQIGGNTYNPRVGVAYQVDDKTVLRAGYGRSFDIGVFGSVFGHSATQNLPVLSNQSVSPGGTASAFVMGAAPPPAPFYVSPANGNLPNPGYAVNSRSRPTTLRLPTLDAWNAALQRSLSPTVSMTVSYVGNKGTHTFGDSSGNTTNPNEPGIFLSGAQSFNGRALHYDPSAPAKSVAADGGVSDAYPLLRRYYGARLPSCADPAYTAPTTTTGTGSFTPPAPGVCGWTSDVTYFGDNLDTHYNALQASLTKQLTHGYSLTANYAWQQAISENTAFSTWDKNIVRGNDSALRRQQIVVYGLFELPLGKNKALLSNVPGFVNQIVSGIQISPVITYSSGLPFTLSYSSCGNQIPGSAPCRVNGSATAFQKNVVGVPGQGLQYFSAQLGTNFTIPGLDQIGNVGRNSVYGPRFFNGDLSIQKNFSIRERAAFQLRADGFNAFNHINFGNPGGNIDQQGTITSGPFPNGSVNPRQLQFSGRVTF